MQIAHRMQQKVHPSLPRNLGHVPNGFLPCKLSINGHEVRTNPKLRARIAKIRQENEAKARGSLTFIPSLSIRLRCDTAGNVSLSKSLTESGPPDLLRVGAPATATIFIRPRDDTR
jgi:hypothetical protein